MPKKCSVLSKSSDKNTSCLTKKQIKHITKLHNEEHCSTKDCSLPISLDKKSLLKNLKKSLDIRDEEKLAEFDFIKNDPITYYSLKKLLYKKRISPRRNYWLNTNDINDVMYQYALNYQFNYLGAFPSDYFLEREFKPKNPSYLILNTDPAHKPGSHWVSMIISPDKRVSFWRIWKIY